MYNIFNLNVFFCFDVYCIRPHDWHRKKFSKPIRPVELILFLMILALSLHHFLFQSNETELLSSELFSSS